MKRSDVLFLLFVVAAIVYAAPRIDRYLSDKYPWEQNGVSATEVRPDPKPMSGICDSFALKKLLHRGASLYDVEALNTDRKGWEECVVLYSEAPRPGSTRRPVYGWVYHFQMRGEPDFQAGVVPVSKMQRYDLLTDYGGRVQLGSIPGTRSDGNPSTGNIEVRVINADGQGGPELVILDYNAEGQLTGLSVFRWRADEERYQLVGYARGEWLETDPNPIERQINKVIVYDRVYPADAAVPERIESYVFTWQDGKLMLDPHRKVTDVPQ